MTTKYPSPLYDASDDDTVFMYQEKPVMFSAITDACDTDVVWVIRDGTPIARWECGAWEYYVGVKVVSEGALTNEGVGMPRLAKSNGMPCVPVTSFKEVV